MTTGNEGNRLSAIKFPLITDQDDNIYTEESTLPKRLLMSIANVYIQIVNFKLNSPLLLVIINFRQISFGIKLNEAYLFVSQLFFILI